jgi:hypothetical protein
VRGRSGAAHVPWDLRRRASRRLCIATVVVGVQQYYKHRVERASCCAGTFLLRSGVVGTLCGAAVYSVLEERALT